MTLSLAIPIAAVHPLYRPTSLYTRSPYWPSRYAVASCVRDGHAPTFQTPTNQLTDMGCYAGFFAYFCAIFAIFCHLAAKLPASADLHVSCLRHSIRLKLARRRPEISRTVHHSYFRIAISNDLRAKVIFMQTFSIVRTLQNASPVQDSWISYFPALLKTWLRTGAGIFLE